jgi:hypothetical protein
LDSGDYFGILVVSPYETIHDPYVLDSIYSRSLKNHEAEDFVEPMFEMGRDTLALPFEEKMKYWQGNKGDSFG